MGDQAAITKKGLLERLDEGAVICAEGYLFEFERRGYLQAGAFVPEVVLEHPDLVRQCHRDFVHAGSDIVEAFTYYAHREKLRLVGRENDLERINATALEIAAGVAAESGSLLAGNICNTNIYDPADAGSHKAARAMFEEQIGWAMEHAIDLIVAETFAWAGEALLAIEAARRAGVPIVATVSIHGEDAVREGWSPAEACRRMEAAGADVVGLNCVRGPATTLPLLAGIREAVSCHVAALPVPYRTSEAEPTFHVLCDHARGHDDIPNGMPFPTALDPFMCSRYEIAAFGREAMALGVNYLGVCCGASPHHIRSLAEAVGKRPPASRYSADMTKHAFFGTDPSLNAANKSVRI